MQLFWRDAPFIPLSPLGQGLAPAAAPGGGPVESHPLQPTQRADTLRPLKKEKGLSTVTEQVTERLPFGILYTYIIVFQIGIYGDAFY